jgi:hypothetical protein
MPAERATTDRTIEWRKLLEEALTVQGSVGSIYNRFYTYSFTNQMLLRMQGITEPVATYKRWQSLGRQVMKGSKAREIVRPIVIKRKDEATDEDVSFKRYKMVKCLFPVSETTGADLPPWQPAEWRVDRALKAMGITQVPFRELDGNVQGYSFERNLAINPAAAYPFKTTLHEIGHIVLGHTTQTTETEPNPFVHRGVHEFQVESTAYIVGNELEALDDEQRLVSRGYIQHWLADHRPTDPQVRPIFTAVGEILRAGRPAIEPMM